MAIFTIAYEALWITTETDRSKTDDVIFICGIPQISQHFAFLFFQPDFTVLPNFA
jgi:hypothetical protein